MKTLYIYLCFSICSIMSPYPLHASMSIPEIVDLSTEELGVNKTQLVHMFPNKETNENLNKNATHVFKIHDKILKIPEHGRDSEELKSLQILKSQMMAKDTKPSDNGLTPIFDFVFDDKTYNVIAVHPTDMCIIDQSNHTTRTINFSYDDLNQIGALNANEKIVQIQPFITVTKFYQIFKQSFRQNNFTQIEKNEEFLANILIQLIKNGYPHRDAHSDNIFIDNAQTYNPKIYIIDWSGSREVENLVLVTFLQFKALSLNAQRMGEQLFTLSFPNKSPFIIEHFTRGVDLLSIFKTADNTKKHREFHKYLFNINYFSFFFDNKPKKISFKDYINGTVSYIRQHIFKLQDNNLSCGFKELTLQLTAIKYFDFKIKDFENL